jgi:hypothetical protein
MADPITDRAVQILSADTGVFMPLEELYDTLAAEGLMAWIDMDTFLDLIESDERFEIIQGLEDIILLEDDETGDEMEGLDILGGPWVLLRERDASPLEVMSDLLQHLQQMNQTLEQAWKRASHDPAAESELIHMLLLGDMLERKVRETMRQVLRETLGEVGVPPQADVIGPDIKPEP